LVAMMSKLHKKTRIRAARWASNGEEWRGRSETLSDFQDTLAERRIAR
ncbi:hypothetical protein A2U01_0089419, partial [Trifolium medium]|nr:hypothetical protein [Trifolium medium]